MKLIEHFNDFLSDTVNLNKTRLEQLDDSIKALKDVIRDSDWKPKVQRFVAQGSWAHKTIIKPIEKSAFDADLLVLVSPVADWSAKEYISSLRAVFANHKTYEDKVRRYSHCVTIEYAGERKIDLAPCVVDSGGTAGFEVCNHDTDAFERSEPEKYTDWLVERNGWTTGNGLRKVTRLLKYLRDIKGTFSCTSVLFTTLLGYRIEAGDVSKSDAFCDVPTALKTIVGRLDDWLQARSTRPSVKNPVLDSEDFSDSWDDERYANFREKIHKYRGWIDDAYNEPERAKSIEKWRRVFGEEFARSVVLDRAACASDAIILAEAPARPLQAVVGDLVSRLSYLGLAALPAGFDLIPHKRTPRWRALPSPLFPVEVAATFHARRNGAVVRDVRSGGGPLAKERWLQFRLRAGPVALNTSEFEVHWRVTNTGAEAEWAGCLRGGFETSENGATRWESLSYRGVHTVEAFVVRRRDQALVAQSPSFYVVVE